MGRKYPYQNLSLKDMKGELWKDIPGLDGYFCVSNYGRIKRSKFEMQFRDGRTIIRKEKIIKSQIQKFWNRFSRDYTYYLTTRVTLQNKYYRYGVARLVYDRFVEAIELDGSQFVVLAKDCDNFNIIPSNLIGTTLHFKNKRMFQRNRIISPFVSLPEKIRLKQQRATAKAISKKVTQYTPAGKKIKTFSSMAAAARATGTYPDMIGQVVTGKKIAAKGFLWRLGNEKKIKGQELIDRRRKEYRLNYQAVSVTQYDMKGNRIAYYPSLLEAGQVTGIQASHIGAVARGLNRSAGGYFWVKGDGREKIDLSDHKWGIGSMNAARSKKIKQFTVDGKYVRTFNNSKDAAAFIGVKASTITGACRGYQITCKGYKWRFA
jgi:NUMOD4 motif/NUMOD1 domain